MKVETPAGGTGIVQAKAGRLGCGLAFTGNLPKEAISLYRNFLHFAAPAFSETEDD